MKQGRFIPCPSCGKKGDWLAASSGPFCSSRCKLVDLGNWLGGEHVISSQLQGDENVGPEESGIPISSSKSEPVLG